MVGDLSPSGVTNPTVVATGIFSPAHLSIDPAMNYIFYTEEGGTGLYRRDYDGTNRYELRDYGAMTGFMEIAYSSNAGGVFGSLISEENYGGTYVPENYDGFTPPSLPSVPSNSPYDSYEYRGIAVDDGNELVYLLAVDNGLIVTTDFSGNVINAISTGGVGTPGCLAYDEGTSKFYFAEYSGGNHILYSINMDGTGKTALVTSASDITSIKVYPQFGKIYYVVTNAIRSVNLNGTGDTQVLSVTGVEDIDIEPDFTAPTFTGIPADDAVNVDHTMTQLIMNFSENVKKVSGVATGVQDWIRIFRNGIPVDTIAKTSSALSVSGSTVMINVSGVLSQANNYHVLIGNNVIEDMSGNNFIGISLQTGWNFGTQCISSLLPGTPLSNQLVCIGGNPDELVGGAASGGNGVFSYQWESSTTSSSSGFSNIADATDENYDPPSGISVTTYYRRKVSSGTCAQAISDPVTISLIPQPTISTPPADAEVCVGGAASFQIEVTPATSYGYQWQIFNGTDFVNINDGAVYSGTSTDVLSISDLTGLNGSQYRCEVSYGGFCTLNSVAATLTVNALPTGTDQTPAAVCENPPGSGTASFDLTTLNAGVTGGQANRTVQWFSDSDLTTPVATPASVTVSAAIPFYARVTNDLTGCVSALPAEARFAITTAPTVSALPVAPVICSGTATAVTLSGAASYSWTVSSNPNVTGAVAGTGAAISQTLTNTSAVQQQIDYTITPSTTGCAGSPLVLQVKVEPAPVAVATPSAPLICSGANTNVTLSGADTYNWTISSNPNITGASSGSGASISQILTNTASSQQQIDYTITPERDGCTGSPLVMTVRVEPSPVAGATPPAPVICSGTATGITLSGAGSYSWVVSSNPQITGASSGSGSSISHVLTNTSASIQELEYTITPSTAGCTGAPVVVTVGVTPEPIVTALPSSPVICSGAATGITLSGAASYSWTVSANASITGASAGSGSSINQTLTNVTTASQQINYAVTPVNGSCSGSPVVVQVTVNPKPTVTPSPASETICSGASTNITLSGASSYSWTAASNPNITGSSAGSGSLISQTLINAQITQQQLMYVVTPSANGCTGNPVSVQVMVRGLLTKFDVSGGSTVCEGQTAFVDLSNTQPGISYEILRDGQAGGTSAAPGGGAFRFPVTIAGTYTVRASNAFSCSVMMNGAATVAFSTAPSGTGSITGNTTVCVGGEESYIVTGIEGAMRYEWEFPEGFTLIGEPDADPSFQIQDTQGGLMRVHGVNECGRGNTVELSVTVLASPDIQLVLPAAVAGRPAIFSYSSDTPISSATWDFGDDSGPVAGSEAEHAFSSEGVYTITVGFITGGGCQVEKSEVIEVAGPFGSEAGFSDSNIKNVITANGDSKNAYLFIEGIDDFPDNEVILIDRWGMEVFNVSGYNNNWDLRKNGDFIPAGNYVCIVRLKGYNEVFKRSITVIKAR